MLIYQISYKENKPNVNGLDIIFVAAITMEKAIECFNKSFPETEIFICIKCSTITKQTTSLNAFIITMSGYIEHLKFNRPHPHPPQPQS